jgi:hypothetical protein
MGKKHYITVDNGRVRISSRLKMAMDRIDRERDKIAMERDPYPTGCDNNNIIKAHSPIAEQN